jgi:hypothetical protein
VRIRCLSRRRHKTAVVLRQVFLLQSPAALPPAGKCGLAFDLTNHPAPLKARAPGRRSRAGRAVSLFITGGNR